jgi:uncharacterized membrane protein
VFVAIGMMTLWPDGSSKKHFKSANAQETFLADVTALKSTACHQAAEYETSDAKCVVAQIKLLSGSHKGETGAFTFDGLGKQPDVGDKVRVIANAQVAPPAAGLAGDAELDGTTTQTSAVPDPTAQDNTYSFTDYDRTSPMLWLLVLFVGVALVVSRMRAALSLIGLAVSLAVVLGFIVPAILDGHSPLGVAVIGSLAVMLVTMVLAHGVGLKTASAAIGTTVALLITVLLAYLFTEAANLTGFSSDDTAYLQASGGHISLRGLVLAGMVIAALGVLDDLTVTQASAVLTLRKHNPAAKAAQLYRDALEIGHDHIAATINTLVLAYVGAALPTLLVFSVGGLPFSETINSEVIAEQVVATLVGSIGLIAAVPVTTGLAALLAVKMAPSSIPEEAHAH